MKFNVGLGQIAPALGDVAGNLQLHLDRIAEAVERGVDLLIFPELALTCLLYTSPSPRDGLLSRMPSSA